MKKGEKRPANVGRKAGVPNKASLTLRELMDAQTPGTPAPVALYIAGRQMVDMGLEAMDSGTMSAGVSAIGKALSFAYPNLKAIEHSGGMDLKSPPVLQIIMESEKKSNDTEGQRC